MSFARPTFPFSAIVGQELLKRALLLAAIDPALGGVLIRGEKGTAKSTGARALAHLLPPITVVDGCAVGCDPSPDAPHCPDCEARLVQRPLTERVQPVPFVDLPIGATEDRVLGTLDFSQAIRQGERHFEPGLLARAHRGILYVDEVNLLPDHLVDTLLDAAATGVHTVEREGISLSHPAQFLLVGTMNPDEGDLRPQLLDRFALAVPVLTPTSIAERTEIVRRRIAFDANPPAFAAEWRDADAAERARVLAARRLLPRVQVPADLLALIAQIAVETRVEGLRADIVLYRAARALSAYDGRTRAGPDDVRLAAELALPHRQREPLDNPPASMATVESLISKYQQAQDSPPDGEPPPGSTSSDGPPPAGPSPQPPNDAPAPRPEDSSDEMLFAPQEIPELPRTSTPAVPGHPRLPRRSAGTSPARRGRPRVLAGSGVAVRSVPAAFAGAFSGSLDLPATLRAAARARPPGDGSPLAVALEDVRVKQRAVPVSARILFLVDASGSMAARTRMAVAKGAVLALLADAYRARDEVALVAFRGATPCLLLPFTRGGPRARRLLSDLPVGGRTPLAQALTLAGRLFRQSVATEVAHILVLVSDGRANVPLEGAEPFAAAIEAAEHLRATGVSSLVVDAEAGQVRLGRAQALARVLGAPCVSLHAEADTARRLAEAVRHVRAAAAHAPYTGRRLVWTGGPRPTRPSEGQAGTAHPKPAEEVV